MDRRKTSRGHAHGHQPDRHRPNRHQPNGDGPDRCHPDGHGADRDQPQGNPTDAEQPDGDPAHGHQADRDVAQGNDPAGASQPIAAICLAAPDRDVHDRQLSPDLLGAVVNCHSSPAALTLSMPRDLNLVLASALGPGTIKGCVAVRKGC